MSILLVMCDNDFTAILIINKTIIMIVKLNDKM